MTIGKLSGQCDFGQKGQSYCNQRGQSCVAKRVKVAWLFQRLRVYGYMDNVWVFSKSKTYPDPENINTNGYANGSEYPLPHKFTLGAEITF